MMMLRLGMLMAVTASCLALNGLHSYADDPEAQTPEAKQAELRSSYVDDLVAANQMAAFGKQHKAPEALIAAASLLLKVDAQSKGKIEDRSDKPTDEQGNEIKDEAIKGQDLKAQAKAWLDEASTRAAGTKLSASVESLIKEALERKYVDPDVKERGAAGGPKRVVRTIGPNQTHVYRFKMLGGMPAAAGLTSTGQSRLRFTIEGVQGNNLFNLTCTYARYNWVPRATGQVTFRIHNGGNAPTTYTLFTN